MNLFARSAALALALSVSVPAMAQNIVQNSGFETGDFSSWVVGNPNIYTNVINISGSTGYGSGSYAAQFGTIGSESSLSQGLTTAAGTSYTISFDLRNDGGVPNSFSALFGSNVLTTLNDSNPFGLRSYSFVADASSALTALTFNFRQDPSFFYLDNVSVIANTVSAAPEPATWAFMIVGFGAAGVAMRRSRKKVTVAYA